MSIKFSEYRANSPQQNRIKPCNIFIFLLIQLALYFPDSDFFSLIRLTFPLKQRATIPQVPRLSAVMFHNSQTNSGQIRVIPRGGRFTAISSWKNGETIRPLTPVTGDVGGDNMDGDNGVDNIIIGLGRLITDAVASDSEDTAASASEEQITVPERITQSGGGGGDGDGGCFINAGGLRFP